MRRWIDALNAALATATVAYAIWGWPRLPAEIPVHFALDGQPDRWTPATPLSWFLLPGLSVATLVLIVALREWAVRRPGVLNLPGGKKLHEFDERLHAGILEHMRLVMAVVSTEVLVIFGLIQAGSFRAATGGSGELTILAVLAVAVLSTPVILVVFFLGFQRVIRTPLA